MTVNTVVRFLPVMALELVFSCSATGPQNDGAASLPATEVVNLLVDEVFADYFNCPCVVYTDLKGLSDDMPTQIRGMDVRGHDGVDFVSIRASPPQYLYSAHESTGAAASPSVVDDDAVPFPEGATEATLLQLRLNATRRDPVSAYVIATCESVFRQTNVRLTLRHVGGAWQIDQIVRAEEVDFLRQ